MPYTPQTWTDNSVSAPAGPISAARLTVIENGITNATGTIYNVKAFGAVGDGVADDTAEIQSALTAAGVDGGVVYLPIGTYKVSGRLTITTNQGVIPAAGTVIRGDGEEATIIQSTNAADHVIYGQDVSNISISDLSVYGASSSPAAFHGIYFDQTSLSQAGISLSNLVVDTVPGDGYRFESVITSTFRNCRAADCGTNGFHAINGTSQTYASCYARACAQGYFLDTLNYSTLNGCACDSSTGGAYTIQAGTAVSLHSCGSEVTTGTAYKISGNEHSLYSCYTSGQGGAAFWFTSNANRAGLYHCREVAGGGTNGVLIDAGCKVVVAFTSTASTDSLAAGSFFRISDTLLEHRASSGTVTERIHRNANTNSASRIWGTNGTDSWNFGLINGGEDLVFTDSINGGTAMVMENRTTRNNIQLLGATKEFGGGVGVIGLHNANTVPSTNATVGGILYCEAGALKYRGSSGTVTVLGVA